MTSRRVTEAETRYADERAQLIASAPKETIANAPFLFSTRILTTGMLSRIEMFKMIMGIPGAIIECGVYKGNSLALFLQLSILLEPYAINRSIIGFDTFEGFRSIDATADPLDINETMFSDTDQSIIQRAIDLNDIVRPVNRIPRCEIVAGDILATVPEFVKARPELCVALLLLDTDLYLPTKVALEHFVPLMPKGALVVFDEVAYRHFPGETQALKEYFNLNKVELKRLPFESSIGYFQV